jgi:23S rRNA (uracil1939-C5)-methyltransferase
MVAEAPRQRLSAGVGIEGEIVDLAYGGAGVLRDAAGVVMVRRAFPGDRIRARVRRRRKGIYEADLEEIVTPSPDRIAILCPHAEICGGCPLQGLAPEAQTRWKAQQAVELLRRIGDVTPIEVADPWRAPRDWFYRNKMEFTFARRPWVSRAELDRGEPLPPGPALGLHPPGRYEAVFDLTDCRLQSRLSNRIVAAVRRAARSRRLPAYDSRGDRGLLRHVVIRQAATTEDLLLVLVVRHGDPVLAELADELRREIEPLTGIVASINRRRATVAQGDEERLLWGSPHWHERIAGLTFRVGASSFFQTQTAGAAALIEEVLAVADPQPTERILDLYCGAGALSLPVARRARELCGVELLPAAITEARENARRNGIENVHFLCSAVEGREPQPWEAEAWDLVLVDPPRSGLHPRALGKLLRVGAPRLLYVSCNPATLARDAGRLVTEGGYAARRLRVFDLFPQTPHLESVLLLERGGRVPA